MSITFTIFNNDEYCDANGLTSNVTHDCQCKDFDMPNCWHCDGTQKVHLRNVPFEVNCSNSNGIHWLEMMAIEADYCGSVHPQKIKDGIEFVKSMRLAGINVMERETVKLTGKKGCVVIEIGFDDDQLDRYIESFGKMAEEALRREEQIVWA